MLRRVVNRSRLLPLPSFATLHHVAANTAASTTENSSPPGLSRHHRRLVRRVPTSSSARNDAASNAAVGFHVMLHACLSAENYPVLNSLLRNLPSSYKPSASLLRAHQALLSDTPAHPHLSASDSAIESFLRLCTLHSPDVATFRTLLCEIRVSPQHPHVSLLNMSAQTWSVLRYMRSRRMEPSVPIVNDALANFVSALDLQSVLMLLQAALQEENIAHFSADVCNDAVQVALFTCNYDVAKAVLDDFPHQYTRNARTHVLERCLHMATQPANVHAHRPFVEELQSGVQYPPYAYAYAMHAAPSFVDLQALFDAFCASTNGDHGQALYDYLGAVGRAVPYAKLELPMAQYARVDPVMAFLEGARKFGGGDAVHCSLQVVDRFRKEGRKDIGGVCKVVMETCWKNGRGDLAKGLREQIEGLAEGGDVKS